MFIGTISDEVRQLMQPKVSVIIPVYNNAQYLRECLDSAIEQTLKDIEIICVNDGSTDDSLAIMQEYAARDSRIKVIDKPNGGYGHTMNKGLDSATGEYVAFLESDDTIDRGAYEFLADIADRERLDIVKGDYYELRGMGEDRELNPVALSRNPARYNTVVTPREEPWTFYMPMMNCLGLFRRDLLEDNHIRHNETPGAAHQDMGFWFQTLASAQSLMFVDRPFYEYRQDNMNASMKSDKTTFSTLDEYAFVREFLRARPELEIQLLPIFFHRKFTSSMFSYDRAELSLRLPFLRQLAAEFREDLDAGAFAFERFNGDQKRQLQSLLDDPDAYYIETLSSTSAKIMEALKDEVSALRLQMDNLRANREARVTQAEEDARLDESPDIFLSIIIPAYNAESYIGELLDSLLPQMQPDVEVICVDDGSTDGTLNVLDSYAREHESIRVFHQENQGQGAARNYALKLARGTYIQFADSDDKLRGDAISVVRDVLAERALDVLFFDGDTFYESDDLAEEFKSFGSNYKREQSHLGDFTGPELFRQLKAEDAYRVSPCMAVFNRRHLRENDIAFPEGIIYEDNVFALKAICLARSAAHINESLYLRRIRQGSTMTSLKTAKNVRSYFEVYYQMFLFASQHEWDYATAKAIAGEMRTVLGFIRRQFNSLSKAQRMAVCTLPPVQETLMDSLVAQTAEQKKREYADKRLEKAKEKNKALRESKSWRIGRKITAPARAVKKIIRK